MSTEKLGKKIVITIITLLLLSIIFTIIINAVYGQANEMGTVIFYGFVRFTLIGSILYFLYAGNKVAKWLIVVLSLFGGVSGFLVTLSVFSKVVIAISILNMAVNIIYIAIGVVLIVSSPVNSFLRFQREFKNESNDCESEI